MMRRLRGMSLVPALLAGLLLAGCESQYRQDPLLVRGSSNATVYGFAPIYIDRPLAENIANSLIFADYNVLINRAGLNQIFIGPKPYTVFAVTDPGFDQIPDIYRQRLLDPANQAGLRQLMAYTIVPGRYTLVDLTDLARRGGGRAGLRTLDGSILNITLEPSGALTLSDPSGRVSQFVLADILQSNGILYAGTTLLAPN